MGSLIEELYRTATLSKQFHPSSEYPFLKNLPESKLYRCGKEEILERKTRSAAVRTRTLNELRFPQFFSAIHVAALYGLPNEELYTYSVKTPLKLLSLEGEAGVEFLKVFYSVTKEYPEDFAVCLNLCICLGFNPLDESTPEYLQFNQQLKTRLLSLCEKEKDILLNHKFPESKVFNRVSISDFDRKVFNSVLNHKYKDESIKNFFTSIDGIYFPPMDSGYFNKTVFLTQFGLFHEEIFLKKTAVTTLEIEDPKPLSSIYDLAFRVTGIDFSKKQYPNILQTNTDILFNYIYAFQQAYSASAGVYLTMIEHCKKLSTSLVNLENGFAYKDWCESFYKKMIEDIEIATTPLYRALVQSFEIHPQLFVGLDPAKNPFVDMREDLIIFTCLSDSLKAFISKFEDFLTAFDLTMFLPVASGGILFGAYTFGDFRRLTKDIDVKIIQTEKSLTNTRAMNLTTEEDIIIQQEKDHTFLTLCIFIWGSMFQEALEVIAHSRIRAVLNKYGTVYPELKNHALVKDTIETSLRFTNSYIYDIIQFIERIIIENSYEYSNIESKSDEKGIFIRDFDNYLQKKLDINIFTFLNTRNELLKNKKKATLEEKTEINKKLNEYEGYVWEYVSYVQPYYFKDMSVKTLMEMYTKEFSRIVNRPNLGSTIPFKINFFSSIYITVKGGKDAIRDYGLVDFTFDTKYASKGTFQYPSGIHESGTIRSSNGMLYAPFYYFIYETNKLKKICDASYIPSEDGINPYNKCSPVPKSRESKIEKYRERYTMVFNFCKGPLAEKIKKENKSIGEAFSSIESLDNVIEILKKLTTLTNDRQFSIYVFNYANTENIHMPLIGGRRKTRSSKHFKHSKHSKHSSKKIKAITRKNVKG